MNPGFLSLILIIIVLILLASGWKRTLLPGIPDAAVLIFFAGWFVSALFRFTLYGHPETSGTVLWLSATALAAALCRRPPLQVLHLVSLGLFLASLYYVLKHLGDLNPFFIPGHSWSSGAMVVAIAASLLLRRTTDQIAAVSIALLLGSALYGSAYPDRWTAVLGGLPFQDEWWFTIVTARLLSVAGEWVSAAVRGASKSLSDRWKGLKK
ncbi:hypothetical protein ACFFNY_28670 [Paenibacillus hodogayensis]|uniref:DUF4203 domain-containing protein n=1 Tax=Paenibacillus hodogayensis TaxID=279208 RepID=A0ABV5W5C5_9BACL